MFQTPTYDYGSAANRLTTSKGLDDIAQTYGRFLSQERHRRTMGDANRQFKREFPKVGSSFNARGLYDSGLRREGQQRYAQDYQRFNDRQNYDYGVQQAASAQSDVLRNAQYQQALLGLYEQMQKQRAAGYDPFAALGGLF